jgi:hypothetical protein
VENCVPNDLITLAEAAALLPGRRPGCRLAVNTLHRWCVRSVRGVQLRSQLVGGHRMTSRTWLAEFLAAVNDRSSVLSTLEEAES